MSRALALVLLLAGCDPIVAAQYRICVAAGPPTAAPEVVRAAAIVCQ